MKGQAFAVRIGLTTPVALETLLHLDGLLMALQADAGGDPFDIPLDNRDRVALGSAAFLETGLFGADEHTVTRIKRISPDLVPEGGMSHLPRHQRKVDPMSPYRARLTPHKVLAGIRALWFTGTGDPEATADLLSRAGNIGGMKRTGYGRTDGDVQLHKVHATPWTGIALASGLPSRLVATANWDRWNLTRHADAVVYETRPAPPYWSGPVEPCIGPMQDDLMGTKAEIRAMLAIA